MIFHYLDAGARVKRYYHEKGTAWVHDVFAHQREIASASLALVEVVATLARKRKAGETDPVQFERKAQELEDDWEHFIQIHLTAEVVENAKELARQLALRRTDYAPSFRC